MKKQKVQLLVAFCCVMMVMAVGCGSKSKTQNTNEVPQKESTQTGQALEKTKVLNKDAKEEVKTEDTKEEAQKQEDTKVTSKDETKTDDKKEKHTLEGTLAEKKDFMFVVEDAEKKPNAFAFSEKPQGYDDLKDGDKVVVEYTGEVSEVDAFTGGVLSVTKSESKGK